MAELKRAQCSRRGYLSHLKKLLQSAEELLSRTGTLGNDDVAALRDLHEQLQRKQDLITALDVKILEATKGDDEIEAEVLQSEETASATRGPQRSLNLVHLSLNLSESLRIFESFYKNLRFFRLSVT